MNNHRYIRWWINCYCLSPERVEKVY